MNKSKAIRDIIIIIIVCAAAVYIISNRPSGPAGSTEESAHMANPPGNQEDVGMMHGQSAPDIKSGEPVITLGDNWVGQGWIDFTAATFIEDDSSHGSSGTGADEAFTLALVSGAYELVYEIALQELDAVADPEELAAKEEEWFSQFESEEAALEFLAENGVTIERMQTMWEGELMGDSLEQAIAEKFSVEPGSTQAQASFESWLMRLMGESEMIFANPDHEAAFRAYFEEADEDPHDHGAMEDDPHDHGETEDDVHTSSAGSDCESHPADAGECDHTSGDEACC